MKTYTLSLLLLLILAACGKKTTVKGRVYNPVTGEGISGIDIVVTKPKHSLGYDGAGAKTVFETTTDSNGNFIIEDRFRKSKTYKLTYVEDSDKYYQIQGEALSINADSDGNELTYPLVPVAYIKLSIQNINCFDNTDHFTLYVSDDFNVIPSNIPFILDGCSGYISPEYKKTISGNIYYHWIVTRNSAITEYFDTLYLNPFEQKDFTISY